MAKDTIRLGDRILIGQHFIASNFDVDPLLSRFFPVPGTFRLMQKRTGALVSGSTALQLFRGQRYLRSDLDCYVHRAERFVVGRYLISVGYQFVPYSWQARSFRAAARDRSIDLIDKNRSYRYRGIAAVFNFVHPSGTSVQIIAACRSPLEVILWYHSSAYTLS